MREIIARWISLTAVVVIVGLSWAFARTAHSADASVKPPPAATPSATATARQVYDREKCATCHSIAGKGNPRHPLDGAGSRWSKPELKEWITATGVASEVLSAGVAKRKERYRQIPPAELDALAEYLFSLKETK